MITSTHVSKNKKYSFLLSWKVLISLYILKVVMLGHAKSTHDMSHEYLLSNQIKCNFFLWWLAKCVLPTTLLWFIDCWWKICWNYDFQSYVNWRFWIVLEYIIFQEKYKDYNSGKFVVVCFNRFQLCVTLKKKIFCVRYPMSFELVRANWHMHSLDLFVTYI